MTLPTHLTSLSEYLAKQSWYDHLALSSDAQEWLLATESLTERLMSVTDGFAVHLVQQSYLPLHASERAVLQDDQYVVREVVLHDAGIPLVFARSVIPQSLCQGEFVGLGNQPLGKILFNDKRFVRQPFTLTRIDQGSVFAQAWNAKADLFGRRSVFAYADLQLLVAEVFLPASPAYGVSL